MGRNPNRAMVRFRSWGTMVLPLMVLAVLLAGVTPAAWSQTATSGALKGVVLDPSGAVIANADVRVINQGTGERRHVMSNSSGVFIVPLLSPGRYRVEAGANGFEKVVHPDINVKVTETTTLDVRLPVGSASTTVEVNTAPPIVQTSTTSLGEVVGQKEVQALPLVTRNYTQILDLSAGVASSVTRADELGRGSGGVIPTTVEGQGLYVQGARATDNSFQMNGVDINDIAGQGFGVAIPNPDTIQEFRVQTGMYDAEYGRTAGANVDLVTKTGTNTFHGGLFEFWRNDVLNANDFFLKQNHVPQPELKQNQYGGTFGGPILKDKLLFFTSYQGTRQVNAVQGRQTIVSPVLTNDRSPAGIAAGYAGQRGVFQNEFGGVGPAVAADGSNINPVALRLLEMKLPDGSYLFPTPNPSTGLVSLAAPATFNENQYMGNFQYIRSQKNSLEGRFFTALSNQLNPFYGSGNLIGAPLGTGQTYVVASLSYNTMFSPSMFNQVRFGYSRVNQTSEPQAPFTFSGIGITSSAQNNALPNIGVSGSDDIDTSPYAPSVENNYDLADNFSWVRGNHSLRFGGELTRAQQVNPGQTYNGTIAFPSWPDFLLGLNGAQNGTGIFSNVLDTVELLGVLQTAARAWQASLYAQDDYKVDARLTLNLGFRYDWLPPFTALDGRATNINPALLNPNPPASGSLAGYVVPANFTAPIPAGVTKSGVNSFAPGSSANNFAPRIGFAYLPLPNNNRVVLRGGYGIYYSFIIGNSQFQSVPGLPWVDLRVGVPPFNGNATFQSPFPQPIPPLSAFPFFEPYSPSTDISSIATQQNIRPGITQEYTLNVQTQLAQNLALQVGYVGSKADHLIYSHSINQAQSASAANPIRGETTNTLANLALRVPYQGFDPANFQEQGSEGRSNYNSLEVTLKKNFSNGLQFVAAYTWSKTMATSAATVVGTVLGGGTIGNQNNLYADYGPADFSRPNRLIISGLYQVPTLHGGSRTSRMLLGGWAVSGVGTFQSGTPLTFTNVNSTNLFGTSNDFAYYSPSAPGCNGHIRRSGSVNSRLTEYFNTSCFTAPPTISADGGTAFGNAGPGKLRGPAQTNVDAAISRVFPIGRGARYDLMFRAEAFNVFNTSQFANPDTAYSDGAAFGQITATSVAPRIGQLALKLNF